MLRVENLCVSILGSQILRNVSIEVKAREIVGIVGRNGAGKTTLLNSIMGLITKDSGKIIFNGEEITKLRPEDISKRGIGYAPEGREIFSDLNVQENILIPVWARKLPKYSETQVLELVYEIFPALNSLRNRKGIHLSGGEQKMLAIARAIASQPSLLILDEPLEGLAHKLVIEFADYIKMLRHKLGISVLIAESKLENILNLADRAYVIDRGEIIYEGPPEGIMEHESLLRVLGKL